MTFLKQVGQERERGDFETRRCREVLETYLRMPSQTIDSSQNTVTEAECKARGLLVENAEH